MKQGAGRQAIEKTYRSIKNFRANVGFGRIWTGLMSRRRQKGRFRLRSMLSIGNGDLACFSAKTKFFLLSLAPINHCGWLISK